MNNTTSVPRCVLLVVACLLAITAVGCTASSVPARINVRLTGSQIATELVESWLHGARSYRFETERPEFPTWSEVGFRSLAAGQCDIACTDRPIEPRELEAFGDRDVHGYRVGWYGYALYVHPDNPLDSIFAKHVGLVFQKRITDWHELAGPELPQFSGPITLYGPQKRTRGGMILMRQANIWFENPTWTALSSDEQIIDRVASDPLALGFASVGYDDGVRYLGLRMERGGKPALPSLEEIETQRYGLAKVIYVYCTAPPNEAAAAVIEYLFSPRGSREIQSTNIHPIPRQRAALTPSP